MSGVLRGRVMDPREELVHHIRWNVYDSDDEIPEEIAESILAAGYRKMPSESALWNAIVQVRDDYPRSSDDAPTDEIVAAILALMDGDK